MDLPQAKLTWGIGTSYIDELNVNLTQIPIQAETIFKKTIEIIVLKLKMKVVKHF